MRRFHTGQPENIVRLAAIALVVGAATLAAQTTATGSYGIEFVQLQPGEFTMGCSPGDSECIDWELPAHRVRITKSFQIGKYEVTQEQWQAVMGYNWSSFRGSTLPVENVSWDEIQQFMQGLNARNDGFRYRLPTEAEWEYAARAGTTEKYAGAAALGEVAWYSDNSGRQTHPVGQKRPNAWGLYDMLGNVSELCQDWLKGDWYKGDPSSAGDDTAGPSSGTLRVVRGASWSWTAIGARVSMRAGVAPSRQGADTGFRCVREVSRPSIAAVVNAASFQPGPVAPGELTTVFGSELGPPEPTLGRTSDGAYPKVIAQTRVYFDDLEAPLLYVSAGQISVVAPFGISGRSKVLLKVEYKKTGSVAYELPVGVAVPALFTGTGSGLGPAAALNQDGSVNAVGNPAACGSIVVLYGTGGGDIDGAPSDGGITDTATPIKLPVVATASGMQARVLYYGSAPGLVAGVFQLNVQLPPNCGRGEIPFYATAGGFRSPSPVTLFVTSGGDLSYSVNPQTAAFDAAGGRGTVTVSTLPPSLTWTVTSNANWINIGTPVVYGGNRTIQYSVPPNPDYWPRRGTMTIAGQTVTIMQAGALCTPVSYRVSLSPQNWPASGGTGKLAVTTGSQCPWTVTSEAPWLTIPRDQQEGRGAAEVQFTISQNASNIARVGRLAVEGNNLQIAQMGVYRSVQCQTVGDNTHWGDIAVLLRDGKVLLAGAQATELFDPATRKFSKVADLPTPGTEGGVAMLADGRLLIAGGTIGSSWQDWQSVSSAYLYDPATQGFSATGSLATPRSGSTFTRLSDGRVIVLGGQQYVGQQSVGLRVKPETYDPRIGRFSRVDLSAYRWPEVFEFYDHQSTVLPNDLILISGGSIPVSSSSVIVGLATLTLFDAKSNRVLAEYILKGNRAAHTATLLADGTVLLAGGAYYDGQMKIQGTSEICDVIRQEVRPAGSPLTGRSSAAATLLQDGRVLVSGGAGANHSPVYGTIEVYDPVSGRFAALGALATARFGHRQIVLPDGTLVIAGGTKAGFSRVGSLEVCAFVP